MAVNNFAARLDKRTRAIAKRLKQGKQQSDASRHRHALVIRGYKIRDETVAFQIMLDTPERGDDGPKWVPHSFSMETQIFSSWVC